MAIQDLLFSSAEEDLQWSPDPSAGLPPTYLNRKEHLDKISLALKETYSAVITGDAGVGKNSLTRSAILGQKQSDPGSRWIVCEIGYKELLCSPNMTQCFVETVRNTLGSHSELGLGVDSELLCRPISNVLEACRYFRQLGTFLLGKRTQLVLYFRSFHHMWWDETLRSEYQSSGGTKGRLSDLIYLLGVIQKPALDWREDWARSFRSLIVGRNMTDVGLTFQTVSGFRPRIISIPALTKEELSQQLELGWGDSWKKLGSEDKDGIQTIVACHTALLPQSVHAYGFEIGWRLEQLSLTSVKQLPLAPFIWAPKHTHELNEQTASIVADDVEQLLDVWADGLWKMPRIERPDLLVPRHD